MESQRKRQENAKMPLHFWKVVMSSCCNLLIYKCLYDIAENKIKNEAQKEIIRSSFPPHIANRMCAAIDGQEKMEHFIRFLNEYNEWIAQQQMQQAAVVEFLRQYKK